MSALLEDARIAKTKESIGMFPQEAQDAAFTPPEQRTPMQWQMYHRSAQRLPGDEAVAKSLKGEAKEKYDALKSELAKYDSLKPADPPIGEIMVDQARIMPATYILSKGVYDAPLDEVQPGFLSIIDPNPAKVVPPANLNSSGRRTALANWLTDLKARGMLKDTLVVWGGKSDALRSMKKVWGAIIIRGDLPSGWRAAASKAGNISARRCGRSG